MKGRLGNWKNSLTDEQLELAWDLYRYSREKRGHGSWFNDRLWASCVQRAREQVP